MNKEIKSLLAKYAHILRQVTVVSFAQHFVESFNHRMALVGRGPKVIRFQPPATGRATNLQIWY